MTATRFNLEILRGSARTFHNGFRDSANFGDVMLQWGQDVNKSDGPEVHRFDRDFHGSCHAVFTTYAHGNVRSAMPVTRRDAAGFTIDRHRDMNGASPFYWLAIGDRAGAPVTKRRRQSAHHDDVTLCWADARSTTDKNQVFDLPARIGPGPAAVLTTAMRVDERSALSVEGLAKGGKVRLAAGSKDQLVIDRDGDVDGKVPFNYLAVGSSTGARPNPGVVRFGEHKLQWGRATSTSDHEEIFMLQEAFATMDFAVLLTSAKENLRSAFSLARPINPLSFVVNRDGAINGKLPFYWVAIGR